MVHDCSFTSCTQFATRPKHEAPAAIRKSRFHTIGRKRSSKACKSCRIRKVRCNVTEHGPPCTNCRLDDAECVLVESKRTRKSLPGVEQNSYDLSADTSLGNMPKNVAGTLMDSRSKVQGLADIKKTHDSSSGEDAIPHKASDDAMRSEWHDNIARTTREANKTEENLPDLDLLQDLTLLGVSILQSIIKCLRDINSADEELRLPSLQGFCQHVQALKKLREPCITADRSITLAEALVCCADIELPVPVSAPSNYRLREKRALSIQYLIDASTAQHPVPSYQTQNQTTTPSPEPNGSTIQSGGSRALGGVRNSNSPTNSDILRKLDVDLASMSPESELRSEPRLEHHSCAAVSHYDYASDFDAMVNYSGLEPSCSDIATNELSDRHYTSLQNVDMPMQG